ATVHLPHPAPPPSPSTPLFRSNVSTATPCLADSAIQVVGARTTGRKALLMTARRRMSRSVSAAGTEGSVTTNRAVGRLLDIGDRSEEHTSELQSRFDLVCRPPL